MLLVILHDFAEHMFIHRKDNVFVQSYLTIMSERMGFHFRYLAKEISRESERVTDINVVPFY